MNLAIAEKQLGLPIPEESIAQMSDNLVRLVSLIADYVDQIVDDSTSLLNNSR